MNRWTSLVTITLFALARPGIGAVTLHVATDGNDAWSGRLAAANASATDGPLASLAGARDAIRKLKAGQRLKEPVTVWLHGGVYRLRQAVEFTPQDSGIAECPITYEAWQGQRPVISGGRPITGWKKGDKGPWQAIVPEVGEGKWLFHQLFVNGQRRIRARTPNRGYLYTEGIIKPFDRSKWWAGNIDAKTGFRFREGDIKDWQNADDAMIVIYHSWTTSIHRITAVDRAERIVRLAPASAWPIGYWWEYNTRYQVENVPEALDEPGEWYLDRKTGVLSYWPMPGEDLTTAEVIAPAVRQTLVTFQGKPAAKTSVQYLRFRGISFRHADCYLAADMPLDQQGATPQKPLVAAEGLRHATFEDCELACAGENGLWLGAGCTDNVVRRCHIHDLGGGAVFIGATGNPASEELAVRRNVVDNNFLHDGSHIFRGSQGVWIGQSSDNQVTHNEICDFHHLGISVGHSWGYAPSAAAGNRIEHNHVHHICNGYFSDGGGIYTLGVSPGTVVRHNVVHDILPTPLMPDGGCGIYLDEGSTGIVVENNIVYNTGAGAFNQHYGRENVVQNNVFAFASREPITCCRVEQHLSYTFRHNILLVRCGQATSAHYSPVRCKTAFSGNLYWDLSGKEPSFSGGTFAQWQASGRDKDGLIADPQFVDAPQYDFRLKPSSPSLKLGFRPIDTRDVGLYGDAEWVAAPAKIHRQPPAELPPPPPAPPPRPFREDFESFAPGKQPEGFSFSPAGRPDLISVSAEAAADGKQSLKFVDAAGLPFSWQPHLYFSPGKYTSGRVRFACDVMNSKDRPSEFDLALRQWDEQPYREGPSLVIAADGSLSACGKVLTRLPLGTWIHLDIQLDLGTAQTGAGASKAYRLAVTARGQKEQVFDRLPYLHPQFSRLTWVGFASTGKPGAVFFIDNVRVEKVR